MGARSGRRGRRGRRRPPASWSPGTWPTSSTCSTSRPRPALRRRGIGPRAHGRGARLRGERARPHRAPRGAAHRTGAAIKLYRGLGFTALGVRPGYYADNDEDAIEMILALDPESGRAAPGRDEIRIDG